MESGWVGCPLGKVGWSPVEWQPGRLAPGHRDKAAILSHFVDTDDAIFQIYFLLPPGDFLVVRYGIFRSDEEPARGIVEWDQLFVEFLIAALKPGENGLGHVLMLGGLQR